MMAKKNHIKKEHVPFCMLKVSSKVKTIHARDEIRTKNQKQAIIITLLAFFIEMLQYDWL